MESMGSRVRMGRRRPILVGCVVCWSLLAGILSLGAEPPRRPNIVFILIDDLRWDDLACTGNPFVKTPHIDRIAREGANFRNAFAATPLCSPSRASILTGLHSRAHGVCDNTNHDALSHQLDTFLLRLKQAGYTTAFFGKWHMGTDDSPRPGVDHWLSFKGQGEYINPQINLNGKEQQASGYATDILNQHAVEFLRQPHDRPFMLYLSHKAVHPNLQQAADGSISDPTAANFVPSEKYRQLYSDVTIPRCQNALVDLPEGKQALLRKIGDLPPLSRATGTSDEVIRDRLRMLASVEEGVGMIFQALQETGQLDNTLLVFTSDHGYFYGEHGLSVERRLGYEETARIPLLVRYPPLVKAGSEIKQLVQTIDFAPTFLELGQAKTPPNLHGRSLVPLLKGEPAKVRDAILIEYFSDKVFPRMHNMGYQAVRTADWKYIHYTDLADSDELYNLQSDSYELRNLIADPNSQRKLQALQEELQRLVRSAEKAPQPAHAALNPSESASSFFKNYCLECHSGERPKGDLRLDQLSRDFANEAVQEKWSEVLRRIEAGEMPPTQKQQEKKEKTEKERPRPSEQEVQALSQWIRTQTQAMAVANKSDQGRVVLRRLNRNEYENTVRDLLGIEVELKELIPVDSSADGFDNVGEALHTSSFLMERYLEAADKALNLAISNLPQPPLVQKRYTLKEEHAVKLAVEKVYRKLDDTVVMFSSSHWNAITVGQFYPPDRGKYRIRISAYGFQSSDKPVTFRIDAGPMLQGTKNHLVGYFDVDPNKPTVIEFFDHFEARNHIRISPFGLAPAQVVDKVGADKYEGPGLAVEWVEVEGPLFDGWPPESHRRIFGDLPQEPASYRDWRNQVEVVSKEPLADARRVLRNFARRAFRRAVTDQDIDPLVALVERKLGDGYSFEQAVRVGLEGAMLSPEFLFLRERPGPLDDFALASRLSYFLWSTMPDEELLTLAEQHKLRQPEVLRAQVERLLASPKTSAFTENFIGQWLALRNIDFTEPDRQLYPEFDDMLKAAIVQETHSFFNELLKNDLSITNFVASDFTMLNERLAKHYGINGVQGHAFRKVVLPPGSHRGGVLTMASVLKVTANGTTTSPVVRGAWVLDRILGTPPKPPPAGVAAVEPDIRGATTIREQLAKHRQVESCAGCHSQFDPLGFALESFDVIGGWRENYRSNGNGEYVTVDGQKMPYLKGKKVDPADVLPDGRKFQDIDELKQILVQNKDQLARALTTKLVTYATGRAPQVADRDKVEAIVATIREKNYGLRSLVHEIVQSELFRMK